MFRFITSLFFQFIFSSNRRWINRYRDFKKSLHQVHHKGKTTGVAQSAVDSLIAVLIDFLLQKFQHHFNIFKKMGSVGFLTLKKNQAFRGLDWFSSLSNQIPYSSTFFSHQYYMTLQLMKNPSTPQRFWLPILNDSVIV